MDLSKSSSLFTPTISNDIQQLDSYQRLDLLLKFWPISGLTLKNAQEKSYDSFLEYVGHQLSNLYIHQSKFAAQDFDPTADLIQTLLQNRDKNRSEIVELIQRVFLNVDEEAIIRSAELTLRLWLTVNIHSTGTAIGPIQADDTSVDWPAETSLNALLHNQFPKSRHKYPVSHSQQGALIDRDLTVAYLFNVCDIRLHWTNNLIDHLSLDRKRRVLTIYRHKICLVNHARTPETTILPLDLLQETIDTLNLLFPISDGRTKALLIGEGDSEPLFELGNCGRNMRFDLAHYDHWRDRLEALIDVFNEPPRHWRQLMSDRRNKLNFATFWVAVLVLVLTIVSMICGVMSNVYTVKQYNLAVAQACSLPDAASILPFYCT